jgi:hypothetical protein
MDVNQASREELISAVCRVCRTPLTPEQADLGAEMFTCPCGCTEIYFPDSNSNLMESEF